jgi:uncharacterized protein YwqG
MNIEKLVDDHITTAIEMIITENKGPSLKIGASKLGGKPDLPKEFDWPYFEDASALESQRKNQPLSFLGQINCEDIVECDQEEKLPKQGILYFFYEMASMAWGFDPKDKGCSRVYYYNLDDKELVTKEFPDDLEDAFKIPEARIEYQKKESAPSYEEIYPDEDTKVWDAYENCLAEKGLLEVENCSKLLGYADLIQGEMTLECEMVSNGLYCGDSENYTDENIKKYKKTASQWQLLLQLDGVEFENYNLMFGDCGRAFFYIKESDLKGKKFDNTWFILQCY